MLLAQIEVLNPATNFGLVPPKWLTFYADQVPKIRAPWSLDYLRVKVTDDTSNSCAVDMAVFIGREEVYRRITNFDSTGANGAPVSGSGFNVSPYQEAVGLNGARMVSGEQLSAVIFGAVRSGLPSPNFLRINLQLFGSLGK